MTVGIGDMKTRVMQVTPEIASVWLSKNTNNRKLREKHVKRLSHAMERGEFTLTHQGIAFSDDGTLLDGQHRLSAVVRSGMTVEMLVVTGVKDNAIMNVDRVAPRSIADCLRLSGNPTTNEIIALANAMMAMPNIWQSHFQATNQEINEFIQVHSSAIEFAITKMPRKYGSAPVRSAIARAWYHVEHDRLSLFCEIMSCGESENYNSNTDRVARQMRELVISQKNSAGGGNSRVRLYKKTQRAIAAFASFQKLASIRECDDDLFPLPEVNPSR